MRTAPGNPTLITSKAEIAAPTLALLIHDTPNRPFSFKGYATN